jgi:predicted DNA-binding transcriptional regulator AlpA
MDLSNDRILNAKQVCDTTGISRVTLWRLSKNGNFPPAIQLSPNRIGWSRKAIEEWLQANVVKACRAA